MFDKNNDKQITLNSLINNARALSG